jgi:hypothetical protein
MALTIIVLGFISMNKNDNSSIRDKVDKKRKDIARLLKNNPSTVNFLENVIYLSEDKVLVTYEKGIVVFYVDGKEKKIDEDTKGELTSIFQIFNCKNISLDHDHSGKVLEIYLGNVTIDKENIYSHLLIYSTNKSEEYDKEIFPNWYYEVLFYI